MSIYEVTYGNAYCGDPSYDNLTGYVTRTYQSEWRDIHGNLWRKTCTVINLGRSDAVTPADPEAQMGRAYLDELAGAPIRRHPKGQTVARFVDVLRRYGPLPVARIVELTGHSKQAIVATLNYNDTVFVRVGEVMGARGKVAATWGLIGLHDGEVI